jgi:hypothetical protein
LNAISDDAVKGQLKADLPRCSCHLGICKRPPAHST